MMRLRGLRHFLLVLEMVGVEGLITINFVILISNLVSLGVPIDYASLPIFVAALSSLIVMPVLGQINIRWATTLKLKAFCLVNVNFLQLLGATLVLVANLMKLYENYSRENKPLHSLPTSNTTQPQFEIASATNFLPNVSSVLTKRETQNLYSASMTPMSLDAVVSEISQSESLSGFGVNTVLALIGFMLVDSGYDVSSCFLKTFALSSTSTQHHPSIIVKTIIVSSVGGCLVTLLVSVGLPEMVADSVQMDINAVTAVFLFGLIMLVAIPSITISLITGLFCADTEQLDFDNENAAEDDEIRSEYVNDDEKLPLLGVTNKTFNHETDDEWQGSVFSSYNTEGGRISRAQSRISTSVEVAERIWQLSQSGCHSLVDHTFTGSYNRVRHESQKENQIILEITEASSTSARHFFKKNINKIILCAASFFSFGAGFVFNMYSVNFVASSIYKGDAAAPIDSQVYADYAKGMKAGSTGLLLFYASFVAGTMAQAFLLNKIGWWVEIVVTFLSYAAANMACAVTKMVWVYYVTSALNGMYRAVIFSVPYILVCRLGSTEEAANNGGNPSGMNTWDITLVAAMLPLSMSLIAPLMGPLMSMTGTATSPLYFTVVISLIGLGLFSFLRKY